MSDNRSQNAAGLADPGTDPGSEPAGSPAASTAVPQDAVVRRTRDGWRVGGADVPDLTCAMVLADLLAAELAAEQLAEQAAEQATESPPGQEPAAASENSRLRATVRQLEHALIARVRVE